MSLVIASLALGFLNAWVRPIAVVLTFPILIVTFGLFYFVINGFLLWFVGRWVKGFSVDTFWAAVWGGLVISIVGIFVNRMLGRPTDSEIKLGRQKSPRDHQPPAIDV